MKANYRFQGRLLEIFFELDKGEGVAEGNEKVISRSMNDNYCKFYMPEGWSLQKVHPDLLALTVILLIYPYSNQEIQLSIGVSQEFSDLCAEVIKKKVTPVDPALKPRKALKTAKVALAYSGGVDSTAALALLPEDTYLFFVDRLLMDERPHPYNKEAAYYAYDVLSRQGRLTYKMPTDFEDRLRNPIGFPTDVACAVPCILLADFYPTNSVAMGTVLEGAYKIGRQRYECYTKSWHHNTWRSLFKGVDLPISAVTMGLSEVATSMIVEKAGYKDIAQSCINGRLHKPCMRCKKCFRKIMLDECIENGTVSDETILKLFAVPDIQDIVLDSNILHQDVLMYIAAHYNGTNPIMLQFKKKIGADIRPMDCLERWYSPALEVIAPAYQQYVKTQINKYVGTMDKKDERCVETWDNSKIVSHKVYKEANRELQRLLSQLTEDA